MSLPGLVLVSYLTLHHLSGIVRALCQIAESPRITPSGRSRRSPEAHSAPSKVALRRQRRGARDRGDGAPRPGRLFGWGSWFLSF